jgi:hypothetical protein
MTYIKPDAVTSPKAHWAQEAVLFDGGEEQCAYALGRWDGTPRIGFRWNGSEENPIGNPQSRGLPTWTMLDPRLHEAVLALLPPQQQAQARRFFGTALTFEGVTINDDGSSIIMWNVRAKPPIVAVVACSIIRDIVGSRTVSKEDCRLLVEANKDLMAEVADALFHQPRVKTVDGLRVIEIGPDDLILIVSRFSTSVLQVAAHSGWVGLR